MMSIVTSCHQIWCMQGCDDMMMSIDTVDQLWSHDSSCNRHQRWCHDHHWPRLLEESCDHNDHSCRMIKIWSLWWSWSQLWSHCDIIIVINTCHQFEASKGMMTCDHNYDVIDVNYWHQLWWSHVIIPLLASNWWHVIIIMMMSCAIDIIIVTSLSSIMMITCHYTLTSLKLMTCDHNYDVTWWHHNHQLWWSHVITPLAAVIWWHVITIMMSKLTS